MSNSISEQPPPLPPRSPRPPATAYTCSPQQSVAGYPPQTSAVSLNPGGPPPPIPPRPPGYEIRNHTPAHTPSSVYTPLSPTAQVNPSFPLPPPPPRPPPPRIAPVIDTSAPVHDNLQPGHLGSLNSAYQFSSPQTYRFPSPTTWTNLPPPPPGPPPQGPSSPSLHISSRFPQYTPAPARPLSAAETPGGIPTSQSLSVQSPYKTNFLDIGETHDDSFNNLACPGGKAYTYQAPATTYEPSSSPPPAYSPLPEHLQSAPAPLSAAPFVLTADKDVQRFNGVSDTSPPSVSPSTQQPELESLFQSLHVTSPPSIPPKTPLPPRTTQLHSAKSAGSVLGAIPVGYHSTYQAQIQPAYDSSGNASTQSSEAQQTPANPLVSRHDPASPAYLAPLRGRTPKAVTACIDIPMLFSTDWYWHLEAPDFFICSRCYVDHIWTTKFQDEFQSAKYTDGKPRVCRFSKPRMKYYIFVEALKSGSLRSAIEWMRLRSKIPDCKGVAGVKGKFSTGIQWYRARENAIPGFVSCQACYEDLVMTTQFAPNFELITEPQPMDTIWACDVAIPFIENEYEKKGQLNDWQSFASKARARITAQGCPGGTITRTYGKKWFVPKAVPRGPVVLCATCYCDHVMHSGEEDKWEMAPELTSSFDRKARCSQGMFNVRMLFAAARLKKDFVLFWNALDKLSREKSCEAEGITDGVWYTLPSKPRQFSVCAACYAGILEPLDMSHLWVRNNDVSPGTKVLCCFNLSHPRLNGFLPRLLEAHLTLDPTALDEHASVYAAIPLCLRDEDAPNRRWYGWKDCTICPECYVDFARHSPLAKLMEYRDTLLAESTLCDMYSPRMRKLYTECGSTNPPDLKRLFEYSVQRQIVYNETIPRARKIISQARMASTQQQMLNTSSSHYTNAGQLQENIYGKSDYTYSAQGVGYGYANLDALHGAAYGKQATDIVANVGSAGHVMAVRELEQRWRAVE